MTADNDIIIFVIFYQNISFFTLFVSIEITCYLWPEVTLVIDSLDFGSFGQSISFSRLLPLSKSPVASGQRLLLLFTSLFWYLLPKHPVFPAFRLYRNHM